jgi:uncharacterized protein YbjT (DUF2867 family)
MRVAVVGATGRIGRETTTALEGAGHEVVPISRSSGVDVHSGAGLAAALEGVAAVVDASNTPAQDEKEIVEFFGTATRNLLAAEKAAGVGHHVLLSIVGIDHGQPVPHYAGKRTQEKLVREGGVPFTIVRATQFHDFAAMVAGWAEQDGTATIAPLLVQPIAPGDVGEILAEVATGEPSGDVLEIAGPETQDLVDMARRTYAARGRQIRLVPTWRGNFDTSMAGEVLLPGPDARLGHTTFDAWLADGAD